MMKRIHQNRSSQGLLGGQIETEKSILTEIDGGYRLVEKKTNTKRPGSSRALPFTSIVFS